MNSTPLNTATAAGAAAVVMPVVSYAANALHMSLPTDVQSALVVLIVASAHWLSQRVPARKQPATPAQ